ncbi:MAG TPA: hypothetical protein VLC09_05045, partial [Polyangiaceae bacterium]|nr:hypothetical protein [Polyangiaceae bacterium]
DLSDLLAIPPARMHTRPMSSETPSAFPSESPANDAPSTAPGGRRRESASYQDEPTRERVPAPPSVHPPSGNGPKSVATSPDLAPASLPAQHKEPAASKEPAVSREPAVQSPAAPELAHVTFEGNPLERLAMAIRERWSGALAQQTSGGIRRVVLRDGDFSTLTSSAESESLVQFLVTRGDLSQDAAATLRNLPRFGRHAGAALVAQGTLRQEDLWGVLRGHAEWLLGLILGSPEQLIVDQNTPQRLLEEPTAFGGAAGAEVYVDVLRRILNPADAFTRLGAGQLELGWGAHQSLLAETGLPADLERQLPGALSQSLTRVRDKTPQMLVVLCALTELGVLSTGGGRRPTPAPEALKERSAEMDDEAFANQVRSRRSLVEEGDYFSILGIARSATRYEVDRACEHWRREFDSARVTARNAHLVPDLELVLAVVEEARLVLSDDVRRERYRKALDLF